MKTIMLMSLLLVVFGVSCAHTATVKKTSEKTSEKTLRGQARPIKKESELIQEGYELFAVIEPGKPLVDHTYILAKDKNTQLEIRDAEGFSQIIRGVSSNEEALELVRLLTSQEIRRYLPDIINTSSFRLPSFQITDMILPFQVVFCDGFFPLIHIII